MMSKPDEEMNALEVLHQLFSKGSNPMPIPEEEVQKANEQAGADIYITRRFQITEAVYSIIKAVGHDLGDPNVEDTPDRVAAAMLDTWFSGYSLNVNNVVTTFANQGDERDLVLVKDIPFYSTCAHHMAPFFGKAHIAYRPKNRVLGLSKFARVLDVFARRLQLQEKITTQVADALMRLLDPEGVMVVLEDVTHTCMTSRGVKAHGTTTSTSAVRGIFSTDSASRAEVLSLIK